ncbi:MAG TPA: HAMP domain-containing sensor histidine kinase [Pirellulales bacterium]|nr:HAMP domain-containing sensor histidine kinase [Pirellulales bacterium]
MPSRWPIRNKLFVCFALLLAIVSMLAWGGIQGLYSYRGLVRSLRRVYELPLATEMMRHVSNLRVTLSEARSVERTPIPGRDKPSAVYELIQEEFHLYLDAVRYTLGKYREQLTDNSPQDPIGDSRGEWITVRAIDQSLSRIEHFVSNGDWLLDRLQAGALAMELEHLEELSAELPSYLHENIHDFTEEARGQYRALLVLAWVTSVITALIFALWVKLFYEWVFRPLRVLIKGSRKVAAGNFEYRIRLDTCDEMAELAQAMNDMTARFRAIRDDLDSQVQERTRQVVRSEQLASVGFLAAGVAHEINNPLASIAMCAESLEGRVEEVLKPDDDRYAPVRNYLRMIQTEAFRCKEITERLLDFSRLGEVKRQTADLRELVQGVIDMISHLGKYSEKHVEMMPGEPVLALINPQEIKQVVLNLIVNGLDSLDPGGAVHIDISRRGSQAVLTVADNGCGMSVEVRKHLFEPFFTRKRGGQGTGLGLSIAYRIIADHEGAIDVHSDGPGHGSRFTVRLPLVESRKELDHYHKAA